MKKRLFAILLACLLLVCTACGAPAEEPTPEPEPEAAPVLPEEPVEEPVEPEAPVEEEPVEEPEEPVEEEPAEEPEEPAEEPEEPAEEPPVEEEPAGPTVEDALAFVDQPLSDLIEAIGEPLEEYYEYSCSGPGDDGLLTYDGFIVFTYREPDGSAEVVIDAEAE